MQIFLQYCYSAILNIELHCSKYCKKIIIFNLTLSPIFCLSSLTLSPLSLTSIATTESLTHRTLYLALTVSESCLLVWIRNHGVLEVRELGDSDLERELENGFWVNEFLRRWTWWSYAGEARVGVAFDEINWIHVCFSSLVLVWGFWAFWTWSERAENEREERDVREDIILRYIILLRRYIILMN